MVRTPFCSVHVRLGPHVPLWAKRETLIKSVSAREKSFVFIHELYLVDYYFVVLLLKKKKKRGLLFASFGFLRLSTALTFQIPRKSPRRMT